MGIIEAMCTAPLNNNKKNDVPDGQRWNALVPATNVPFSSIPSLSGYLLYALSNTERSLIYTLYLMVLPPS